MKKSAGFLIRSKDRYLLCHATGHKGEQSWGIPKGGIDDNETALETAYRETFEETGLDLHKFNVKVGSEPFTSYKVGSKKRVYVFLVEDDAGILQQQKLFCESLVDDDYPENDDFRWVTPQEGVKMAFKSQTELFKALCK